MSGELLLNSWKEIASYMGRSERTVQRWERRFGLPVRRPAGKSRSAVIALPADIETWSRNAPTKIAQTGLSRGTDSRSELPEGKFAGERPAGAAPTLLCIDDREEGLAVRRALLEALGYQVLTASNGKSGLRLFERNQVDLVVLEPSISDLDGDAIVRQLREIKPRVPILLLSRAVRDMSAPLLKLVDNFVHKAQPVGMLLSAIDELCSSPDKGLRDAVAADLSAGPGTKPAA